MGDISAEPSMEDILSSIKRIIAEEGEPGQSRPKRPARVPAPAPAAIAAASSGEAEQPEVLELSEPLGAPDPARGAAETQGYRLEPAPVAAARAPAPAQNSVQAIAQPVAAAAESIVSQQAVAASRGSLEALSKMMVKPEADSDGTLEGLVRELLRPMLREWLDANLPTLVETMVAREIEKITAQQ